MTWQPIETAPTDGTGFLVGQLGTDYIDRAFFVDGELIIVGGNYQPTHWRPLPAAPGTVTAMDDSLLGWLAEFRQRRQRVSDDALKNLGNPDKDTPKWMDVDHLLEIIDKLQ